MISKILMAVLSAVVALPAAAGDFSIDTSHSYVSFKVQHMVVSKTKGQFNDWSGKISLAEDMAKSSVEVTINVASIDTADEDRDEHLRSPDFFDVENSPTMTFKSKRIDKRGGKYVAYGDLTIKGVTKTVALVFTLNGPITDPWSNERIGIEVEPLTIDRQEYGLTWSKTMETGGLMVGNDVTIDIALEAVAAKAKDPA